MSCTPRSGHGSTTGMPRAGTADQRIEAVGLTRDRSSHSPPHTRISRARSTASAAERITVASGFPSAVTICEWLG
jgi:dihydroxyacid dehydratase/phosphogluconate dehydratase